MISLGDAVRKVLVLGFSEVFERKHRDDPAARGHLIRIGGFEKIPPGEDRRCNGDNRCGGAELEIPLRRHLPSRGTVEPDGLASGRRAVLSAVEGRLVPESTSSWSAVSSSRTSSRVWKRSAGSFSRHCRITSASRAGSSGRISFTSWGSSLSTEDNRLDRVQNPKTEGSRLPSRAT